MKPTVAEPVIAVGPKFGKGAEPPAEGISFDWNYPPGSPENIAGIETYTTKLLKVMLEHDWKQSDQDSNHAVQYLVLGKDDLPIKNQPRINLHNGGYDWLVSLGYKVVRAYYWTDADLPNHTTWEKATNEERQKFLGWMFKDVPALRDAFIQFSRSGMHIIQPLAEWEDVWESDTGCTYWYKELQRAGVLVDLRATGWNRLYRFPGAPYSIARKGWERSAAQLEENAKNLAKFEETKRVAKVFKEDWGFYDPRKTDPTDPIAIEFKKRELSARSGAGGSGKRYRAGLGKSFVPDTTIDPKWNIYAEAIGKAIKDGDQAGVHWCYLHLATTLAKLGIPAEVIPQFIGLICNYAGSKNAFANVAGAQKSVKRWLNGQSCSGFAQLAMQFPAVWGVVMHFFGGYSTQTILKGGNKRETVSHEAGTQMLDNAMANPSGKIDLLASSTGIGKTTSAIHVAETAQLMGGGETVTISSNTNALAKQTAKDTLAKGGKYLRLFGAASLTGPDACKFKESAMEMAASDQSVINVMCNGYKGQRCPHYNGCKAREMQEGDDTASLHLGSHGKLHELAKRNQTGKFFLDESPPALLKSVITLADINELLYNSKYFSPRFATAMLPAVLCVKAYIESVGLERQSIEIDKAIAASIDVLEETEIKAALAAAKCSDMDSGDPLKNILLAATMAIDPEKTSQSPPISSTCVERVRTKPAFAKAIGNASKIYSLIRNAFIGNLSTSIEVDHDDEGDRAGYTISRNPALMAVINRPGTTMIMDATGEDQLAALKLYGDVAVTRIDLSDQIKVNREIYAANACRKKIFKKNGVPEFKGVLRDYLRKIQVTIALEKAEGHGKIVCIITYKPVRLVIQYALGLVSDDVPDPAAEWCRCGKSMEELEKCAKEVRRFLLHLVDNTKFIVMHYGAERGKNNASNCDLLVTIGDPRPNLGEVRREANYLGVDTDERMIELTASQLVQALGRARHMSPHREGDYVKLLHIGQVRPSEPQWADEKVLITPPAPEKQPMMTNAEFANLLKASSMSTKEIAEKLGVKPRTCQRWLNGSVMIQSVETNTIRAAFGLEEIDTDVAVKLYPAWTPLIDPDWESREPEERPDPLEGMWFPGDADEDVCVQEDEWHPGLEDDPPDQVAASPG